MSNISQTTFIHNLHYTLPWYEPSTDCADTALSLTLTTVLEFKLRGLPKWCRNATNKYPRSRSKSAPNTPIFSSFFFFSFDFSFIETEEEDEEVQEGREVVDLCIAMTWSFCCWSKYATITYSLYEPIPPVNGLSNPACARNTLKFRLNIPVNTVYTVK